MGFILRFLVSLILAALIGTGSVYYVLRYSTGQSGAIQNGPWSADLTAGGTNADGYTRTRVALWGVLALNKSETIYFTARKDSAGDRFDGRCTYRVEGRDPDARWWSITAYGNDSFLIDNPEKRYAIGKTNVVRSADGSFVIRVSPEHIDENWIFSTKEGFDLTLRLYNPGPTVLSDPATAPLPTITKEACSS